MGKKKILVLLSRQHSFSGKVIYWTCGRSYTHASISLDETGKCFYSFNFKGFCEEHPRKLQSWQKKNRVCYELEIGDREYKRIKKRIAYFVKRKSEFRYSTFGLILCLLRIPHKFERHYFCSQFVAETLEMCHSVSIQRKSSLCLPKHLDRALCMRKYVMT